uniref:Putative secreted protein n=1 Tax=Anopheles darlingi TaxID=43151 RepID=A0A2M4D5Q4_ANODA
MHTLNAHRALLAHTTLHPSAAGAACCCTFPPSPDASTVTASVLHNLNFVTANTRHPFSPFPAQDLLASFCHF